MLTERLQEARRAAEARYESEIRHLREKLESLRSSSLPTASSSSSLGAELSLPSVVPKLSSVVSKTLAKTVDRIQSFQSDSEQKFDDNRPSMHVSS